MGETWSEIMAYQPNPFVNPNQAIESEPSDVATILIRATARTGAIVGTLKGRL